MVMLALLAVLYISTLVSVLRFFLLPFSRGVGTQTEGNRTLRPIPICGYGRDARYFGYGL